MVNSSLAPQYWHAMWGTSWNLLGHLLWVKQCTVYSIGSLSVAPLMILVLSEVKVMCCMLRCSPICRFLLLDGNLLNLSAKVISFPGLYTIL